LHSSVEGERGDVVVVGDAVDVLPDVDCAAETAMALLPSP
jgi:hypothetical protein